MKFSDIIIIGGGPAGSACAAYLVRQRQRVILIDKKAFPRQKTCAGWISPEVFEDIGIHPDQYPHDIIRYRSIRFHLKRFGLYIPTRQYAIRRYEFDHFLLKSAGVPVWHHRAKRITAGKDFFEIDGRFSCRVLVGAGGTCCPVYRTLFQHENPRLKKCCITALEVEFQCDPEDLQCRLWFFDNRLPGYAWYVPKANGYLNLGIGARQMALKKRDSTIIHHWRLFVRSLRQKGLIPETIPAPKGHHYYLKASHPPGRIGNAYIIGDAAGLATRDMGEGIGPAIKSGIIAARAICHNTTYEPGKIKSYSFPGIVGFTA